MGWDEEEHLLCPVRSINILKQSMDNVSPMVRNIFVYPSDRSKLMSQNALSYLLQETIVQAHQSLEDVHLRPLRFQAHDIWGITASFNLWRNKSVSLILEATAWKTVWREDRWGYIRSRTDSGCWRYYPIGRVFICSLSLPSYVMSLVIMGLRGESAHFHSIVMHPSPRILPYTVGIEVSVLLN